MRLWFAAHGELPERFGSLGRKVVRKLQQCVLLHDGTDIREPLVRHAVAKQLAAEEVGEERKSRGSRPFLVHVARDDDLLDELPHFDELGRAGPRVDIQAAALSPCVGRIVMPDVTEQEAGVCLVDDQADIAADAHGPEVLVLRLR